MDLEECEFYGRIKASKTFMLKVEADFQRLSDVLSSFSQSDHLVSEAQWWDSCLWSGSCSLSDFVIGVLSSNF